MRNPKTNPISLLFEAIMKNHIGLIATIVVLTACIIWIQGKTVPNALQQLLIIIISFLFGTKVKQGEKK
jgi:ABC-type polysaccharide/polyol phosphate export permease